jgi:hypothetical protein
MRSGVYVVVAIIFLIIRLVMKVSKNNQPSNYRRTTPPPPPNMKQPPPYIPPSGQNPYTQPEYNPFSADIFKGTSVHSPNKTSVPPPFSGTTDDAFTNFGAKPPSTKSNMSQGNDAYYCKFCGKKFQSVALLKMDTCFKHPKADQGLQKHELYTGMGRPNIGF